MSSYRITKLRRVVIIALITITLVCLSNIKSDVHSQTIDQTPSTTTEIRPLGIALEELNYPYPVSFLELTNGRY